MILELSQSVNISKLVSGIIVRHWSLKDLFPCISKLPIKILADSLPGESLWRNLTYRCVFTCEVKWKLLRRVWLFAAPWTMQSMGFSRPEYWNGNLSHLQGNFPTQGWSPGLPYCRQILYQLSHKGCSIHMWTQIESGLSLCLFLWSYQPFWIKNTHFWPHLTLITS